MAFPTTNNPDLTRFNVSNKTNILIEISDHSKYWSTQLQTASSGNNFANTYADEITKGGLGGIRRSITSDGGFSTVSDFSFTILNQELESDFLGSAVFFENDAIEVSIIFDDVETPLVYAERIKLFVGVINNITFDETGMLITGVDLSRQENELIPQTVINLRDYIEADSPDIGRPIQVVFGDFTPAETLGYQLFFSCVPVSGTINRSTGKYIISEQTLDIGVSNAKIYKYVPELNIYMPVSASGVTNNGSTPATVVLDSPIEADFNAKPTIFHPDDPGTITDITNMLNDSDSSHTTVGTNPGALEKLIIQLQGFSDPGGLTNSQTLSSNTWQDFQIIIEVGTISGSSAARVKYILNPGDSETTIGADLVASSTNTRNFRDDTGAPDFGSVAPTWDQIRNMGIVIEADIDTVVQITHLYFKIEDIILYYNPTFQKFRAGFVDVREIAKGTTHLPIRTKVTPGLDLLSQSTLFVQVDGAEYGSWITGRGGGASGLSSGDLIEEPMGIIEFIARNYGGLADADIDETAFDTGYTDTSGFTFAGIIDNQVNWIQAINEVAFQCKSRLWFDNEGLLTVSVYDSSAGFTQSGDGTPDETGSTNGQSDVYADEDTAIAVIDADTSKPTLRYNNHLIERGSFEFSYTKLDEIANEVFINYFFNYGANKYQKTTFITDSDSDDGTGTRDESGGRESTASSSKSNYKKTQKIIYNAPFIRDDATAVLLRNHIFDLHVDRRAIVNFTTFYSPLHLQPGDIINIQHPFLTNVVSSVTTKKWEVTGLYVDLDRMRIDVEAMELV